MTVATNKNIDSGIELRSEVQGFSSDHKDIFYAAIQRSRMPMLLTDPNIEDNPIVFFNESFQQLCGYDADEILGRNCRFLQGPETDAGKIAFIRDQVRGEKDCSVELLNYRKDGTPFWNALFVSPVYDMTGKLVYYFASQLDITRRVKSEELLRQTQKIETLGQLTGGIAHDFNNMLTVVIGNINMAQTGLEKGVEVRQYLERAMQAARSSDRLTQQLLSFARKQRMTTERLDLNEVVRQVQTMFERVLGSGVYVTSELTTDPWIVNIDPSHAQSAFLNVLLNARDALDQTGGTIKMRTRNRVVNYETPHPGLEPGAYVELTIEDSGSGMDKETLARVFEPFYTTKPVGQGTGMGMAMVHGFADQSGAKIEVESEVGVGTTIRFYFPTDDEHTIEREDHSSSRILVVEDNLVVRETAVDFLRLHGFTVREADTGEKALDMIEKGYCPDVMFSDIIMPGALDGFLLAKTVKSKYPGIHILLTSGWTNGLDQNTESEFEVLNKPYDLAKLASMLTAMSQLNQYLPHEG
jgi:PAS domain S-box-containing protein